MKGLFLNNTRIVVFNLLIIASCHQPVVQTAQAGDPQVHARDNIRRLLDEEDTDRDRKITVDDGLLRQGSRGDGRFLLRDIYGNMHEIKGVYQLSNLLQRLWRAGKSGEEIIRVDLDSLSENPVDRISRLIRSRYWEGLTRRIDSHDLARVLADEKLHEQVTKYLYVPHGDSTAFRYYKDIAGKQPALNCRVRMLPDTITPQFINSLENRHGLLGLALETGEDGRMRGAPYVVPGGRFNEMYGWDSYFIVLGLLEDGYTSLARSMVNHMIYQIRHYGKILNANRTYYLLRSQPPFFTAMARAVYDQLPESDDRRLWMADVLDAAITEYRTVWMNPRRLTATGLSRYHGQGTGPPPETEHGHFDAIYAPFADSLNMDIRSLESAVRDGDIHIPALDRFFVHDRAMRESGHDTTYRWRIRGEDRCADFVTVDLNCLLYRYEIDIARIIRDVFGGRFTDPAGENHTDDAWYESAARRKKHLHRYLWDDRAGLFFDCLFTGNVRHPYVSATCLYPLWACHADDPETRLVNETQAFSLIRNALLPLEQPGGVAGSTEASRGQLGPGHPSRQWDYPYGWAPHQMIIWQGLLNYGYDRLASRLIYKWLYTIFRNAVDYNGTIPEKYDVAGRTHRVFAEYGNVGTTFSYMTREGFGWMNASCQTGLILLPDSLILSLKKLVPPEQIFRD